MPLMARNGGASSGGRAWVWFPGRSRPGGGNALCLCKLGLAARDGCDCECSLLALSLPAMCPVYEREGGAAACVLGNKHGSELWCKSCDSAIIEAGLRLFCAADRSSIDGRRRSRPPWGAVVRLAEKIPGANIASRAFRVPAVSWEVVAELAKVVGKSPCRG